MPKRPLIIPLLLVSVLVMQACYKKDIEFGTVPENSYTNLVFTDTVQPRLATVLIDSFQTNSATSLLMGKYKDPYLGIISCKPFFQLDAPGSLPDIPVTASFDSLVFIIRLNHYYYGDTTRAQTFYINELAQSISYSYNNQLYNTSNVTVKPTPLGSRNIKFSPAASDSIVIRLDNTKGLELYNKLMQKTDEVSNSADFLNYFKGISISVGVNDTTAVFGLTASATMVMRVIYHLTTPVVEKKYIDFPLLANTLVFNQIISDRSGTPLYLTNQQGLAELASEITGNRSFAQYGSGLLLKMTFPSLKGILSNDNIVKLAKAELVIRPTPLSFDNYRFKLPSRMYLQQTDGSNIGGDLVLDSTLSQTQYAYPVVDGIYGENSYYSFNVTAYVNQMMTNGGTEDDGFFLLDESSTSSMNLDRVVVNDANRTTYKTQLKLSLLVIKK
jgi:hypothetical protein